jgi:DNA-directed RNA polymerase subunit N (RpoN/RPB10)
MESRWSVLISSLLLKFRVEGQVNRSETAFPHQPPPHSLSGSQNQSALDKVGIRRQVHCCRRPKQLEDKLLPDVFEIYGRRFGAVTLEPLKQGGC